MYVWHSVYLHLYMYSLVRGEFRRGVFGRWCKIGKFVSLCGNLIFCVKFCSTRRNCDRGDFGCRFHAGDFVCACMSLCEYMFARVCILYLRIHLSSCMYSYIYIYIHIYIRIYICIYIHITCKIYVYLCIYIYTFTQYDTHIYIHTNTHTRTNMPFYLFTDSLCLTHTLTHSLTHSHRRVWY